MWTDIQSKVIEILDGITGIETVLNYMPVIKTLEDLREIAPLDSSGRINFWVVERISFRINREGMNLRTQEWVHTFRVVGWIATTGDNTSYNDFQNLVESIMEALSENITMGLQNSTMVLSPNVERIDIDWLGDFMCNFTEITIPVREIRTVNYV